MPLKRLKNEIEKHNFKTLLWFRTKQYIHDQVIFRLNTTLCVFDRNENTRQEIFTFLVRHTKYFFLKISGECIEHKFKSIEYYPSFSKTTIEQTLLIFLLNFKTRVNNVHE